MPSLSLSPSVLSPILLMFPLSIGYYNVRVIEQDAAKCSMYGQTAQGQHVAFLAKVDGDESKLAVAVKSNSADLAASLAAELDKVKDLLAAAQ